MDATHATATLHFLQLLLRQLTRFLGLVHRSSPACAPSLLVLVHEGSIRPGLRIPHHIGTASSVLDWPREQTPDDSSGARWTRVPSSFDTTISRRPAEHRAVLIVFA